MDPLDRTARWVQQHSQYAHYRPGADTYSRGQYRQPRPEGTSSHQSSKTDLGGQDHGVGSGGRAYARQTSTAYALAGSSNPSHQIPSPVESMPSSRTHNRYRSHSHSNSYSHSHSRSQTFNNAPQPSDIRPPRLNIPTKIYRSPDLPAFVTGPPGSGYPMQMSSTRQPPPQVRAAAPVQPMSPVQVPVPLNPKVRVYPIYLAFVIHHRRHTLSLN